MWLAHGEALQDDARARLTGDDENQSLRGNFCNGSGEIANDTGIDLRD